VAVRAAALNPVDIAMASGRFYAPVPPPPYVAGAEAMGEVISGEGRATGSRVWCASGTGGFAERLAIDPARTVPVPDDLDDARAVAIGVAGLAGWMPVRDRGGLRPGETVAVLGASGVAGQVAVQAAAGTAGRLIAVARSAEGLARARELGADATVRIDEQDLASALRTAAPDGIDLVVDMIWGDAAVAAIGAMAHGGRLVQVGSASGPTAEVVGGALRGGRLTILGFSVYSEDFADVARAYGELAAAVVAGQVDLQYDEYPLRKAPEAWRRQVAGAGGRKLIIRP
jgi:NADPH2:quinone reductase